MSGIEEVLLRQTQSCTDLHRALQRLYARGVFGPKEAQAAPRVASVTGPWNITATWGGLSVPGSADSVTINSGITVTVPSGYAAQCTTINFTTGVIGAAAINLADATASLTASGAVNIQRPGTGGVSNTINVGAGTFSAASVALQATGGTTRLSQILISSGTATISGNITSAGTASRITFSGAGTLNAGGNFMTGTQGTFTPSTGTVNLNAAGAQTIGSATISYIFNNLTLSGSGAKTLSYATINGILSMEGTATATTTTYGAAATLQYKGTGAQTTGPEFIATWVGSGGVIIANTSGNAVTLGAARTVNAPLTINIGATLDVSASNYALTLGGNWSNGGTFNARAGTVTFNGTGAQTISGNTTWYGLAVTTSTARTVSFQSGVTQTISAGGSLTLTGVSGNLLTLAPVTAGSAWLLNFGGATQNVSYVSVSYSNAGGGTTINATNSTNGGNNTNWRFLPTVTSPTATSITDTTATLGANITSDGGSAITARGTCWGTSAAPTTNCVPEGGTATGVFTQARTGLTAGTLLYYRGYATNSDGTNYSPDGSFYTEPATQASGVNFTSVSYNSMTVNWTRGSGTGVIVLMKSGSAVNSDPADGTYSGYTANPAFGSGTQIGTGNYVVYKGIGTNVTVTGLTAGTTYYVAVYEYSGAVDTSGVNQGTNYKLAPATGNQAALSPTTYYSTGSVAANTTTNWKTNRDGTGSSPVDFGGPDTFVIQNGHSMTTSALWTVSGAASKVQIESGGALTASGANVSTYLFQIDSGGTMTVNSTRTLTINNSAIVPDLAVSGTLVNSGTITLNGPATFYSGGTYQHAQDGGLIPTATWDTNSTCEITGYTTTTGNPPNYTTMFSQSFGNFTWNCTGQTGAITLGGYLTTINGNFTVTSTGTGSLALGNTRAGNLTVDGNFSQSGGSFQITTSVARTMTVSGNFSLSGGTFDLTSAGNGTLNVAGNFSHTGTSTLTETGASTANIVFNGSGTQTYTSGGTVSNTVNFTVNNGTTLMTGTSLVGNGSNGTFTLSSGGTLGIGDPSGITTSGASGNIRVSGTRTYNTGANYIYNGSAAQVTGNGLPATVNNLTINNAAGVTLSGAVTLTMLTIGNVTASSIFSDGGYQVTSTGTLNLTSGTFKLGSAGTATTFPAFGTRNITAGTTVEYAAGVAQTVSSAPSYSNLTSSGGGIKTLDGNTTVNGVLTFTSGNIVTTDPYTLSLGSSASCAVTSGYVDGNLKKTSLSGSFTFCVGQNGYSPVDVNVTAGPGDFTVKAVNAREPNIPSLASGTAALNRYWTLTNSSSTANLVFYYLDADVTEGSEANYNIIKDEAGTLSAPGGTVDTGANTATINGQSSFSNWTLAGLSGSPTAVKLISFNAVEYDGGVLLQWRTGHEVKNLGFNIYRKTGGELERVNTQIIAGSALVAGPNIAIAAGKPYTWWDESSTGRYYLEDVDISGKRTMYGPVTAVAAKSQQTPLIEQSPTLSGLSGMHTAKRDATLKLKPRLSTASAIGLASVDVNAALPPEQVQRHLAGAPAVKIFVQEEGWYRITQPELIAYGLGNVDTRYLQLYVNGRQIPMVVGGEGDRHLDPQDYIEFYGMGLDTPSTDTQTYWLVAATTKGLRVKTVSGRTKVPEPSNFAFTVEARPRELYAPAMPKNTEGDRFYGPIVSSEPAVVMLNLQHADVTAASSAMLDVTLQGIFDGAHNVDVILNDTTIGEVVFSNMDKGYATLQFTQQGLLHEGDNKLQLIARGGDMDSSLVDVVSLTYWHTYTADNDALRFTAHGGGKITVSGFSASDIRVMDITNPNTVWELSRNVAAQESAYAATFSVPFKGPRTLLAFNDNSILHPAAITSNNPSALHSRNNRADMVIIAHSSLMSALTPLKQFREGQGRSVAIIDVEDIYDEFSFGNKTPEAIKDFLLTAHTYWSGKPRFLLLTGDATVDPRDYLGYGLSDLVPTNLVDGVYSEAASDDLFADFNGDGLPEMAVGRIPAGTSDEVHTVVSKIIGYELAAADPWTKKAVVVSDHDPDDVIDFEGDSDEIAAMIAPYMTPPVKKVYRRDYASDALASQDLLNSINAGALIVNYMGHGSEDTWGGNILVASNADSLTNGLKLPFFMNMTCWNGLFASPYVVSLGEALLKAGNGGAIAVWASSGLTDPDPQHVMNRQMITLLFNGTRPTLGEAAVQAKAATTDMDVRRTWILIGDPLTRLKQ